MASTLTFPFSPSMEAAQFDSRRKAAAAVRASKRAKGLGMARVTWSDLVGLRGCSDGDAGEAHAGRGLVGRLGREQRTDQGVARGRHRHSAVRVVPVRLGAGRAHIGAQGVEVVDATRLVSTEAPAAAALVATPNS